MKCSCFKFKQFSNFIFIFLTYWLIKHKKALRFISIRSWKGDLILKFSNTNWHSIKPIMYGLKGSCSIGLFFFLFFFLESKAQAYISKLNSSKGLTFVQHMLPSVSVQGRQWRRHKTNDCVGSGSSVRIKSQETNLFKETIPPTLISEHFI